MTFATWLSTTVANYYGKETNQRFGQYLMNQFMVANPDLASWVMDHTPPCDPFYDDNLIPAFLAYVEANWDRD